MSAKTKRIKAPSLPDEKSFVAVVDHAARTQTQIALIVAQRERAIQRVQATYAERLEPLETELKQAVSLAEKYADEHRDELLPKDRKSAETGLATFGFRLGNPTVRIIGKVKEEVILALLATRKLFDFIRTKQELDRDRILASYRKSDGVLLLAEATDDKPESVIAPAALGLSIGQKETFYIEPKVESGEPAKSEGRAA